MNSKRLALTILVVFLGIWLTNFVIHGFWLAPAYKASASLWRTDAEMQAHLPWLIGGQFLAALAFVIIWVKGFAATATPKTAIVFGLLMGLFSQAATLITYAVQPLPLGIAIRWIASGAAQGVFLGALAFKLYGPKSSSSPSPSPSTPA